MNTNLNNIPRMWLISEAQQKQMPKSREKVKNSSPGKLLAYSRPTVGRLLFTAFYENLLLAVGRLLAVCRPTVGRMSVICWPSVGWEPLSNTRKASARREEHCISTRKESPPYCFGFFRDQSPRNLLCLGILGTKPLTIPSHHPRSQEAKNFFTAASCTFFFLLY